jgi:hypothetical protein
MWQRADVKPETTYRLLLCQSGEDRYLRIVEADREIAEDDALFVTEPVPTELLLTRNVPLIARTVRLREGNNFVVDAHNIWFTEEEALALRNGTAFSHIPWAAGRAPRLAPK